MKSARYPRQTQLFDNLEQVIEEYLLPDYIPPAPIIGRGYIVRTQGSCFAANIAGALREYDLNTIHLLLQEAINSPRANRVIYEHVLDPAKPYAHPLHQKMFPAEILATLRNAIPKENVFILTLGLASTWFLRGTALPTFQLEPKNADDYEQRFESIEDNLDHIRFIVNAVRRLNPNVHVILTVSPVPLSIDTNRGSAVVSDFMSKATLRFAVERYLAEKPAGVYYWPAFEIVRWLGGHLPPVFGMDDGNARHVNHALVALIVSLFLKHYATRDLLTSRVTTDAKLEGISPSTSQS